MSNLSEENFERLLKNKKNNDIQKDNQNLNSKTSLLKNNNKINNKKNLYNLANLILEFFKSM